MPPPSLKAPFEVVEKQKGKNGEQKNGRYKTTQVTEATMTDMVLVCTVMNLIVAEHGDSYDYLLIRGGEFTAITCVVTILLCLIYMTIRAFELDRSFCYDCACPYQMINVFCLQNNFAPLRENVSFHQVAMFNTVAIMMWFAAGS
uniref:Uncharacterized protein n=1 Tax=Romanomermis culicivorax TaxID=13658 RepID=A0A915JS54_ROMCU